MKTETDNIYKSVIDIRPILRKRANGGTLALSPPDAVARFGVTGADDAKAIAAFNAAKYSWAQTLMSDRH